MKQYELKSWSEFRAIVKKIRDEYGYLKISEDRSIRNVVLFRGQSNSEWPLLTTLERNSTETFSVEKYIKCVLRCKYELESSMGRKWEIPDYYELEREISKLDGPLRMPIPRSLHDYFVYFRHHGGPSPLLDWTTSPYIASYFSFYEKTTYDKVAVYAYIEHPRGFKTGWEGSSWISIIEPHLTTHIRHFAQKCWYTMAMIYDQNDKKYKFCNHLNVFDAGREHQDVIIKIVIPSSERLKALNELSDYNINHYTLFQTEESLVKALSLKEFDLEEK